MPISNTAVVNPELTSIFQSGMKMLRSGVEKVTKQTTNQFPLMYFIPILIMTVCVFVYLYYQMKFVENPSNISILLKDSMGKSNSYSDNFNKRIGIKEYLRNLKQQGVPDTHLVLTNFYISTVNAGGIYIPDTSPFSYRSVYSQAGIVSPEAIRAAVLGGARSFVFDIWPDLSPSAHFGPIIQIVEGGSGWRRTSLNYLPLSILLQMLAQEAFESTSRPGYEDPLILFLRFRGVPRQETFNLTARALSNTLEQYRLSTIFNNCRNQDNIFQIPITELLRKVIIASNVRAEKSPLRDYINIGPKAGVKLEYGTTEPRNLPSGGKDQIGVVKQNLTWISSLSESTEDELTNWDYAPSQALGIMFCPMNFWKDGPALKSYMKPDMFGTQSFKIKPVELRYVLEFLPPPLDPPNPGWEKHNAGEPKQPRSLQMP